MTIARRLYTVLGIMVLLISAELSALWFTIHTLSAVRAYVAGEGLWSKAEKDAAYHLEAYGLTRDPKEYRAYEGLLTIWAGDHQANLALTAQPPDLDRVADGFRKGGNDPADIPGMIALFQRFNKISFIAEAIDAWTQGDVLMIRFQHLGSQLHQQVQANSSSATIARTLAQVADVNDQMTVVEDHFSDALGRGSRWLTGLVLKLLLGAALVVELTGLLLTAAITRGISMRLQAMLEASEHVSQGDFTVTLDDSKRDEIGRLAAAFNKMTKDLERERRRAEAAVEARESSLREAQRVAHIGVWEWNFATDQMLLSKEVTRLHGTAQRALEMPFADFAKSIHPDDGPRLDHLVRESLTSGRPLSIDYRVAFANGTERWLCADAKIERDAQDKPIRMVGTMRDITERKQAEKLRLINAEFGQRALASSDILQLEREAVGLVAKTLAAPFVRIGELNAEGTALVMKAGIGWPSRLIEEHVLPINESPQGRESLRLGRPVFFERSDDTNTFKPSSEALALGIVSSATIPIRGKEAILGLLHVGLREPRAFTADDTNFLVSLGTIVGMSIDRDRHEQHIQHLNAELQHRYAELETFSYSVAHDLRAPLRTVAGFADVLAVDYGESLDDEARRYISLVVDGANQMGHLIDALLTLARVSRQEISHRSVDLTAKARSIVADLQASDPERNATVIVEDGLNVAGDPVLLRDMLANLLGNAWKFTRGRDPAVIRFEAQSRDGQTVYAVKDNGVGFATEHAHELFSPFKRLHGKSFEGTGVGLATVARIVGRHGGRVWAESEPGLGATFCFTLGKAS